MSRLRVTDAISGNLLAEVDQESAPALMDPPPGERPFVLPGTGRPAVRGSTPVEVVIAGWRFELEVQDAGLADLRARATADRTSAAHHGPTAVRAIIPGRVVSVAVTPGDSMSQIWPLFLKKTGVNEADFKTVAGDAQTKLNAVMTGQADLLLGYVMDQAIKLQVEKK
jgi:hypothetical protein